MKYQSTVLKIENHELRSYYTQAKSLGELFKHIKEVVELYIEEQDHLNSKATYGPIST